VAAHEPLAPEADAAGVDGALRKNLSDEDSWNREGRGIWDAAGGSRVIDEVSWKRIADPASMPIERLTLAIDVAPDRSVASVGLAGRTPMVGGMSSSMSRRPARTGSGHGSWIGPRRTGCTRSSWTSSRASWRRRTGAATSSGTDKTIQVTLAASEGRDMAIACGKYFDAVMAPEPTLRHADQPQLNVALSVARKRPLGAGWAWNRKDATSDITPVVATTLALWGAQKDDVERPKRRSETRTAVVL
jgi:hypothetical protein